MTILTELEFESSSIRVLFSYDSISSTIYVSERELTEITKVSYSFGKPLKMAST